VGYRKWLLIVTACGLVSGSIFAMFRIGGQRYWIILSLLICILGLKFLWGDSNYKCRKYGSLPIIKYNTRGYPSDIQILDVADKLTQKRYLGYWPDSYDIDDMLKPPEDHKHAHSSDS
jgi:hypothetical protein